MSSRNDITGKFIIVGLEGNIDKYSDGWDRIFGKPKKDDDEGFIVTTEEGKEAVANVVEHVKKLNGGLIVEGGTNATIATTDGSPVINAVSALDNWPTEEWVQTSCLNDCIIRYNSYDEWWDNYTTGTSRRIRKSFIENYLGRHITWEEYDERY